MPSKHTLCDRLTRRGRIDADEHEPTRTPKSMNDERHQRMTDAVAQINEQLGIIEDILDAEASHEDARTRDARDQLSAGETRRLVIESPPGESGPDAVARIDGIVTFVKPRGHTLDAATTAEVKITDVGDSQAHAIATEIVD